MDAGMPTLVFAPVDGSRRAPVRHDPAQGFRMVSDRPVLMALEIEPTAGGWAAYDVIPVRYASLTAAQVACLAPAVVAMPLWARGVDAVQMLQRLAELGYGGPVEVHCPLLPDSRMVMAELSQAARGLAIRLVQPPGPN